MKRILIVEDEPIIRASLKRLLERNDYQVEVAGSVEEARQQPLSSFDLVISDLRLPGEEGTHMIQLMGEIPVLIMTSYAWPGNVRELKNIVERIVVLKESGEISPRDLPEIIRGRRHLAASPNIRISEDGICLNTAVTEFEKALILQSLEKTKWVKNKAAKLLHLNRTTLVEKIKRHHLQELKQCTM